MMNGEFIQDRWIVGLLRDIAGSRGIVFESWSDDWIIELRNTTDVHRVIGYRFDLNNSAASSISQDKVATYTILTHNDIAAVPHALVRTKISHASKKTMQDWTRIVIKPLDGTSGHGVRLFESADAAADAIEASPIQAWAAAPFVDIRREVRVIMLDGTPLLMYEKQPVTIHGLKMFNLGLGATPVDIATDDNILRIARNSMAAISLRLAAVDIVEDTDGLKVLEINDAIMMEHYARHSGENKNRAEKVYSAILDTLFDSHKLRP